MSEGSDYHWLISYNGKKAHWRSLLHIQVSFGTNRSPREGPAQSERGMDSQKPPGEDKDSEPAGE